MINKILDVKYSRNLLYLLLYLNEQGGDERETDKIIKLYHQAKPTSMLPTVATNRAAGYIAMNFITEFSEDKWEKMALVSLGKVLTKAVGVDYTDLSIAVAQAQRYINISHNITTLPMQLANVYVSVAQLQSYDGTNIMVRDDRIAQQAANNLLDVLYECLDEVLTAN